MIRVVCYLPAGQGKSYAASLYADSRAGLGVMKSVVAEVILMPGKYAYQKNVNVKMMPFLLSDVLKIRYI